MLITNQLPPNFTKTPSPLLVSDFYLNSYDYGEFNQKIIVVKKLATFNKLGVFFQNLLAKKLIRLHRRPGGILAHYLTDNYNNQFYLYYRQDSRLDQKYLEQLVLAGYSFYKDQRRHK